MARALFILNDAPTAPSVATRRSSDKSTSSTKDVAMDPRADFARREVVRPGGEAWWLSPMAATERCLLNRAGEEVARETAFVRYAADSRLSAHTHGGGEEFLVLGGSLHDDAGDYPDGTYVRNPIGTAHAPWAGPDGAVLFVKVHQFTAADTPARGDRHPRGALAPESGTRLQHVVAPPARPRARRVGAVGTVNQVDAASTLGRRGDPRAQRCVRGRARHVSQGHLAPQPAPVDAPPVHRARRRADLREDRPPHRVAPRRSRLDPLQPVAGVKPIASASVHHRSRASGTARSAVARQRP
jgi:hypothetical protein